MLCPQTASVSLVSGVSGRRVQSPRQLCTDTFDVRVFDQLGALGPMLLTGQALLTDGAPQNWPVDLPVRHFLPSLPSSKLTLSSLTSFLPYLSFSQLLIVHGTADAVRSPPSPSKSRRRVDLLSFADLSSFLVARPQITSPKASHEFHSLLPAEHIKNKYITVEVRFPLPLSLPSDSSLATTITVVDTLSSFPFPHHSPIFIISSLIAVSLNRTGRFPRASQRARSDLGTPREGRFGVRACSEFERSHFCSG